MHNDLEAKTMSSEEVAIHKARDQLRHYRKESDEEFLERALRGFVQWATDSAPASTTEDYGPITTISAVLEKRMSIAHSAKSMIQAALKFDSRFILLARSSYEVSWSRQTSRDLVAIDLHHSFWPIACLLANKEDEELLEHLLRTVSKYCFSRYKETLDAERAICDNSCVISNDIEKVFPLAARLNYCCHFIGKSLRNWGACLVEDTSIKVSKDDARALKSSTSAYHLLISYDKLIEKSECNLSLIGKFCKSCTGDPQGNQSSTAVDCGMLESNSGHESDFGVFKRVETYGKRLIEVTF